jgi:phage tail protein X
MTRQITTRDGDMVDHLALAAYGRTAGATEAILDANPGLEALGPILPAGVVVTLPELAETPESAVVKLWD